MSNKTHSIMPQAETFLKDSVGIPIISIEESTLEEYSFSPKDYNSSLSVSAEEMKITVVSCYDTSLIDQIVKNFMEISSIDDSEKEELYLDASGEMINIILNLANPKYIKKGMSTSLDTPIKVNSVDDINPPKYSSVLHEKIHTEFGDMTISIIASAKQDKNVKMKVLVADDSIMIRKKMTSMLEEMGHSVITASNGLEAIEVYRENRPDIVSMDLAMPLMSGFETLKRIMKIDSDAKVIIATANNFSDLVLNCMKEGASGYIIKPIKAEVLQDTINKIINDIALDDKKYQDSLFEGME